MPTDPCWRIALPLDTSGNGAEDCSRRSGCAPQIQVKPAPSLFRFSSESPFPCFRPLFSPSLSLFTLSVWQLFSDSLDWHSAVSGLFQGTSKYLRPVRERTGSDWIGGDLTSYLPYLTFFSSLPLFPSNLAHHSIFPNLHLFISWAVGLTFDAGLSLLLAPVFRYGSRYSVLCTFGDSARPSGRFTSHFPSACARVRAPQSIQSINQSINSSSPQPAQRRERIIPGDIAPTTP